MERTVKIKVPDLILTADWHLRETQPTCRTDNFQEVQWDKVNQIKQMQEEYGCPVFHAGDLFDHWKPSPNLLSEAMKHLPDLFWTVYGNHDLPQHNLDLAYKRGVYTLIEAGKVKLLKSTHWGLLPENYSWRLFKDRKVLVWHVMSYQGKKPWPGCVDPSSASLIRKYPDYQLIVTGHNHKSFVEEYEGRYLVNPGSITRQDADQGDHVPCVYFYYAEDNTVKKVPLQYKDNVITREHIDHVKERNTRIDAFVSKLDDDWQAGMSFEQNLEEFEKVNKIRSSVMEIVYKSIEL